MFTQSEEQEDRTRRCSLRPYGVLYVTHIYRACALAARRFSRGLSHIASSLTRGGRGAILGDPGRRYERVVVVKVAQLLGLADYIHGLNSVLLDRPSNWAYLDVIRLLEHVDARACHPTHPRGRLAATAACESRGL
ncbi:hypothetical protein J6590_027955 [Homalodisca vitripennis]|nr:hypothetical protein J6590_027955 [Homalodisca vitripennis]